MSTRRWGRQARLWHDILHLEGAKVPLKGALHHASVGLDLGCTGGGSRPGPLWGTAAPSTASIPTRTKWGEGKASAQQGVRSLRRGGRTGAGRAVSAAAAQRSGGRARRNS